MHLESLNWTRSARYIRWGSALQRPRQLPCAGIHHAAARAFQATFINNPTVGSPAMTPLTHRGGRDMWAAMGAEVANVIERERCAKRGL
jgi:hypothetical protein